MNQDHHFVIGSTHKVCEDYVISGQKNDTRYLILSDGCSSSKNTDIGSRLMCLSALQHIEHSNKEELFRHLTYRTLSTMIAMTDLNKSAMDCTLIAVALKNDKIYVNIIGDGYVQIEYENYSKTITADYINNMPFYLSYLENEFALNEFENLYKDGRTVFSTYETYLNESDISTEQSSSLTYYQSFSIENIKSISIFSDGVASFSQKKDSDTSVSFESYPAYNIIKELTSFKNTNGEFVKRRMQAFLKKCQKDNIVHADDVSCGAITL